MPVMEVLLAPKAGFCFGVKRAVELAEKTVATATGTGLYAGSADP